MMNGGSLYLVIGMPEELHRRSLVDETQDNISKRHIAIGKAVCRHLKGAPSTQSIVQGQDIVPQSFSRSAATVASFGSTAHLGLPVNSVLQQQSATGPGLLAHKSNRKRVRAEEDHEAEESAMTTDASRETASKEARTTKTAESSVKHVKKVGTGKPPVAAKPHHLWSKPVHQQMGRKGKM